MGPARPRCDEDTDPNREHNEYRKTFAESRYKVLRGPGLRAALDLSEDDLDRVAERWLPRQKKAGLAAGVTGMEGINYVTAPRRGAAAACRTVARPHSDANAPESRPCHSRVSVCAPKRSLLT